MIRIINVFGYRYLLLLFQKNLYLYNYCRKICSKYSYSKMYENFHFALDGSRRIFHAFFYQINTTCFSQNLCYGIDWRYASYRRTRVHTNTDRNSRRTLTILQNQERGLYSGGIRKFEMITILNQITYILYDIEMIL